MNSLIHDVLRVESADLDAIAVMPNLMPIRVGERIAGKGKIDRCGNRFVLDLGANAKHHFKAKQFSSSASRHRSYCLSCPNCKKWRKRLFLTEARFGTISRNVTHAFQCKDCIASAVSENKRHSRSSTARSR
jgi:hypothetical protein